MSAMTDRVELGARDTSCAIAAGYRTSMDALRHDLEPRPIAMRADKPQSQPELMKKARDGGIAAALAEMLDKCLDRVWIYPGFRRELKPFWIVTEREIPDTEHRTCEDRSSLRQPDERCVLVIEHVLLEGTQPTTLRSSSGHALKGRCFFGRETSVFPALVVGLLGLGPTLGT